MSSPFVRRLRLGSELRALRLQRGLTTERLGALFLQSRMKISRLENAQVRPDLAEIMDLLDLLEAPDDKRAEIFQIAREGAAKGWWDAYGDTMGDRQRLYADIESGAATIREYFPTALPGNLQLPAYTQSLIEDDIAAGPISYLPERLVEARRRRQETVFRVGGPEYEVILDEVGLRRFSVPPAIMHDQLMHLVEQSALQPRLVLRVFPIRTGRTATPLPKSAFFLYSFPDPADPAVAIEEATAADHVRTRPDEVAKYTRRYESVRSAALSEEESRNLLNEIAHQILDEMGFQP
ncbi:helix-turn-helix domain-containing protein [Actinocorallia populi]|uniref:helix-turn-helix domain-containing protein n=1 Tax=Actinocorallia populi TaxID=2079200 RepID=UPI0013001BBE|nr:helix-turn-helix transcriptional regulator [Actinocorallia populi]